MLEKIYIFVKIVAVVTGIIIFLHEWLGTPKGFFAALNQQINQPDQLQATNDNNKEEMGVPTLTREWSFPIWVCSLSPSTGEPLCSMSPSTGENIPGIKFPPMELSPPVTVNEDSLEDDDDGKT